MIWIIWIIKYGVYALCMVHLMSRYMGSDSNLLQDINLPTLLMGDFNQVQCYTDKMNLGLLDLPFVEPQFTWRNK